MDFLPIALPVGRPQSSLTRSSECLSRRHRTRSALAMTTPTPASPSPRCPRVRRSGLKRRLRCVAPGRVQGSSSCWWTRVPTPQMGGKRAPPSTVVPRRRGGREWQRVSRACRCRQEAEGTQTRVAAGEHVLQEAPQEDGSVEGHLFGGIAVAIVLPFEGNASGLRGPRKRSIRSRADVSLQRCFPGSRGNV